ncbi:hypothetical protein JK636_17225 [Clostridium sp. YIM B02515]|uniref:DUF4179 domain-containing protein n=1 Tax=Clostridium rhizosphaerae TaxID=2803861 RepID=A0ABS1TDT4_9CLOT|nr:hypothetical protein [Clostridium rhizosphaerae]MBL4937465.1 hypothetical protein [Clostridium rhizosphaerae]
MKKSMLFKRVIDENIADKDLILKNVLNSSTRNSIANKRRTSRHVRLSFRFATTFLIIAAVLLFNFPNMSLIPNTKYAENNPDTGTTVKQKNDFMIVAYAASIDNSKTSPGIKVDPNTKNELKPNLKIQMPSGKIKRGNVKKSNGYEVNFEGGSLGLTSMGENIVNITYTSENGMLHYFDVELMKEMETKGELYICQIPVSVDLINPEMGYNSIKKAFSKLWASGDLDEFKNKYFNGKDINLDDYTIGFHGSPDTTGERRYMQIYNKENGRPPYFKEGLVVKATPGKVINWSPDNAMGILQKDGNILYEDLPADTITVSAEFNNGDIVTKTIKLSFNKDGNVIGELNEK